MHGNPIWGIDPTGLAQLVMQLNVQSISSQMRATINPAIQRAGQRAVKHIVCEAAEEAVFQGVYVVLINGIPYVGQSLNIAGRIPDHKAFAKSINASFDGVVGLFKVIPGVDGERAQKFVRELVEQVVLDAFRDIRQLPDLEFNTNNPVSERNFQRRVTRHLGNMTQPELKRIFKRVVDIC